ncbi:hypothetical protein MXD81_07990 [Microbacteriaceae bacterium K1510]|nr:hypothetical protein [Microbacteriaceae bacterium K1510]
MRRAIAESTPMLPMSVVPPLVLFTALILVLSLHGLAASGHFPREYRTAALASGRGTAVLYGSMMLAVLSLLAGLAAAWRVIPWYAAVIGAGGAILIAPLVLQKFPDRFVDGRAALVGFAGVAILLAGLLLGIATDRVALP